MKQVDLDLFEPFDALVRIDILGHSVEVPDNNCLLRSLQYIAGESIAYGRFCWNDECGNCEVTCISEETGQPAVVRACQARVYPGMKVTEVSVEIQIEFD
ncbi:MAG TPA: 2Fe-2S iron-sulfur cluster-binding protein [Patescibacteria group bacterium]|jgi:predicted molibdopterin-dependent oxidoreductase YjgC|nr:2Fe-2S iron-sulfur cluster-binding protein [Patescibacteria group bacterium]